MSGVELTNTLGTGFRNADVAAVVFYQVTKSLNQGIGFRV